MSLKFEIQLHSVARVVKVMILAKSDRSFGSIRAYSPPNKGNEFENQL